MKRTVAGAASGRRSTASPSEAEQVGAAEEAYWRYVKAQDTKSYLALWAEDFAGWPIMDWHPIRKTDIVAFVAKGGLSQVTSYELHRESVDVHGAAAIAFYRAKMSRREVNGKELITTFRMTHTWMKHDGAWKIVGGMSAEEPPNATALQSND